MAVASGPGSTPSRGPQHRLELVERAEGLPLVAGLVLGVGLEHPAPLAQRCRAHHRLDLGQHLPVPADAQEGLHPQLLGLQAELAEPAGLVRGRGPLLQLLEGGALPQRECLRGMVGRPVGLAQREELVAPGHQGLEPPGVEVVGGYGEPVAVRQGLDRVAAERLAQPDDAPLQDLGRGHRWAVAPERVRELVGRDRLPGTDRQRGENDTVPRTEVSRAIDGQRSEDGDDHGSRVDPRARAVNALIPDRYLAGTGAAVDRYRPVSERGGPGRQAPPT